MLRHTLIIGLLALGASSGTQGQVADTSGTFILHFFAQPAGKETYRLSRTASGLQVKSHFEYSDRGAAVPMDFTLDCDSQWRPLGLTITGKSTRFSDLQETITVRSRTVTVDRNKTVSSHTAPKLFFLGDENAQGAVQESLLRYWNLHGRPSSIRVFPAGDVKIQSRGRVVVRVGQREVPLNAYTLSGLIWGQESIWTDQQQHVAAIVEPDLFEIVREEYESSLGWFIENAVVNNLKALSRLTAEASQPARRKIAIVGGVLIDGTGRPPIRDAVVLTENDRITAVGTRSEVAIPKDAFVIPAEGKTILPGLWDMHAHYGQVEFGPIYLANGVTTVRDLGNEIDFIPAVRDAINAGTGIGPHILFAGLVDGRGPRTLGAIVADSTDEAVAIVNRYHSLGASQIKIYSSVKPDLVPVLTRTAHQLGMTVTGHVPVGMDATQAVLAGMDQINHIQYVLRALMPPEQWPALSLTSTQPIPALDFHSADAQRTIAFFRDHGTVVDPTVALMELLAHSLDTPVRSFEPGIDHFAPQLVDQSEQMGVSPANAAKAQAVLRAYLETVRALHAAGVPIVAGTDDAVLAFSLHRELELYVQAGFTPMEAIQAATLVPARVMGVSDEVGTLEVHKRADILIVDGDPLASISNLRKVDAVVTRGRIYHPAPLFKSVEFKP